MRRQRRFLLPTLLVLNGLLSVALAWRASTTRRQVQIWDLRAAAWSELGLTMRGKRDSGPQAGPSGQGSSVKPPSMPSDAQ